MPLIHKDFKSVLPGFGSGVCERDLRCIQFIVFSPSYRYNLHVYLWVPLVLSLWVYSALMGAPLSVAPGRHQQTAWPDPRQLLQPVRTNTSTGAEQMIISMLHAGFYPFLVSVNITFLLKYLMCYT